MIEKLRMLGFEGPYPGGRHSRVVHPKSGKIVPIPIHGGKDVSVALIHAIIRDLGITPDEWLAL